MKINHYNQYRCFTAMKRIFRRLSALSALLAIASVAIGPLATILFPASPILPEVIAQDVSFPKTGFPDTPSPGTLALAADSPSQDPAAHRATEPIALAGTEQAATDPLVSQTSQPQAVAMLDQVVQYLVNGPAFDAKVRETVWTAGREIVGVGTYEQSGGASGRYNLHMTMLDGDGKHRFQQISDGRLAWTRTEIAGEVSLRRVDVGRLDEWLHDDVADSSVSPRLRVGAWAEMLTTIQRDHVLRAASYKLKGRAVWVVTGTLRQERRQAILAQSGLQEWPELYPTRVRIAIAATNDPETGFGQWLPIHIEFRSDPTAQTVASPEGPTPPSKGRLITLIELYSLRPIQPPPMEQFRFENQDAEVNFVNETDRYLQLYGVQLTDRERRQLRR
ncbi:hypothetical protein K227x_13990 [Rubripirellula lacrimiformis]|uniref:Uncharacterized protein n=1 Tax=Rubripirellula lacrimiformis TaxID=1930273 RepID=A0A517N7D9_9BACT|nr:hypothetical protein [Rubripirellula lacrimiformis]QDT03020.1 hypothetical protein K227x_13990 [Rubripirellula lacrimiformis]